MTPRDTVLAAIRHHETAAIPCSLPFDAEVGQALDRHYGGPAWRARLPGFFIEAYAVDTDPKTVIDPVHVRDGFGGIWRQDLRPWHLETPPLAQPSLAGYDFPKPEAFFRPERKAQAAAASRQSDRFRVGCLGWGLFERSWNLRGFENILMDAIADEDFFAEVLDRLTDLYLAFVDYTADLPIDGILFGDDWGDQRGLILGAERWRRFLKPRWARIYAAVRQHGLVTMHHSCGSVAEIIPDLVEIGLDVLESVQPEAADMEPTSLKRRYGDRITFWGCLGSQSTIPFGTPDSIRAEVARLRREMGRGGGFILAPAKPLQVETPLANAVALVEAFSQDLTSHIRPARNGRSSCKVHPLLHPAGTAPQPDHPPSAAKRR